MVDLPEDRRRELQEALFEGQSGKIRAIKLVREATGCGLAEAKAFVEKMQQELYEKHPEQFRSTPTAAGKGCGTAAVLGLLLGGLGLTMGCKLWS